MHPLDPAESVEIIKSRVAKLQHLCGQATLTPQEVDDVERMSKEIARASTMIVVWAEQWIS